MSSQKVLRPVVVQSLAGGDWVHVQEIFDYVEQRVALDQDDHQDHRPGSGYPRWKRNVLNLLFFHKKSGEIQHAGGQSGLYKLKP